MEPLEIREQMKLPNSMAILVMGIASIPLCCCINGIVGLGLGIATLIMANKAMALYQADPSAYTPSSYSNVKAGRICAIIGLVFSLLVILSVIWWIANFGWESLNNPEELQKIIEEWQ